MIEQLCGVKCTAPIAPPATYSSPADAAVVASAAPREPLVDPYLEEVQGWGYQELQEHQRRVVDAAAALHGLGPAADTGVDGLSCDEAGIARAMAGLLAALPEERRAVVAEAARVASAQGKR